MNDYIDVILPIYRSEKYMKNCVASLAAQIYKNFHVILVDNNTDDRSIEIGIEELKKCGIDFTVVHAEKQGVACARNFGISCATHDWVVCVDPDDLLSPRFLEILLGNAKKYDTDVSFASYQIVGEKDLFRGHSEEISSERISEEDMFGHFLRRDLKIIVPAMLIRRSFYDDLKHQNNEIMRTGEDAHHLWVVISSHSAFAYCHTPLYNYYVREGSLTTHIDLAKSRSCHEGFEELETRVKGTPIEPYMPMIKARNDFALLHMAAKHGKYREYKEMRDEFDAKKCHMALKKYPKATIRILAGVNRMFPHLFYLVSHLI